MNDKEFLAGKTIILTPLTSEEIEMLRQWRNNARNFFRDSSIIAPEAQVAWFERYKSKENDLMFVIRTLPSKEPVGAIALYKIDSASGTAEYGPVMIGSPDAAGKGIAREASQLVCDWAFGHLGLNKVYLWVLESNARAIDLYERLGFVEDVPDKSEDRHLFMTLPKSCWNDVSRLQTA